MAPSAPSTARGRDFTVPIPAGFADITSQLLDLKELGGLALGQQTRPAYPQGFRGSIVVTPIPANDFDPTSQQFCADIAATLGAKLQANVESATIIELPTGKTCHYVIVSTSEANRGGSGTIMVSSTSRWMVTCNYDVRDRLARNACTQVLHYWKFDAP